MFDLRRRLTFPHEPGDRLLAQRGGGVEGLDRDALLERLVLPFPYGAHATRPDLADDPIRAETLTGSRLRHWAASPCHTSTAIDRKAAARVR
jgi:hypothetical protein